MAHPEEAVLTLFSMNLSEKQQLQVAQVHKGNLQRLVLRNASHRASILIRPKRIQMVVQILFSTHLETPCLHRMQEIHQLWMLNSRVIKSFKTSLLSRRSKLLLRWCQKRQRECQQENQVVVEALPYAQLLNSLSHEQLLREKRRAVQSFSNLDELLNYSYSLIP